jgi:KDO2-lipid IV(A) lauroyltransferase
VIQVVRGVVRRLPMPVACAFGHGLGVLVYTFARSWRVQSERHVAVAFPDMPPKERRRVARRSFGLLGRGAATFIVAHRMGAARALAHVRIEDSPEVRTALADPRGCLVVTSHFGCFELLAAWLGREHGGRPVGVGTDRDGPVALAIQMRRELGSDTIERGSPREILRTLNAGKPVAFLIDQDTSDVKGVFVPFFGRLAHTPLGPASFAVRTGAPVLMGFIEWTGLARHRAYAAGVLRPRADLPPAEAVLELTARMTKVGEEQIRRRPDHWVWVHRRWQTRPEDHPDYPVYDEVAR